MNLDVEEKISKKNKETKNFFWKHCFKPLIYTFIITIFLQIVFTLMRTYDKMWNEERIPYNVKLEWILDNNIRSIRYNTFIAKNDNYLSSLLQKIHFLVYESAKKKIPDNDPFWIEFWEPASDFSTFSKKKIEHSDEIKKEILENLQLISSNKSKVKSFELYYKYLFVSKLYYRILGKTEYKNKEIKSNFESEVLNVSTSIIKDFFNSNFDFYQYKNDISLSDIQDIPFDFISGILYLYMDLIMTEKKKTCDKNIKELILDKSANYVYRDKHLDSLKEKIQKAFIIYNQQYETLCKHNN